MESQKRAGAHFVRDKNDSVAAPSPSGPTTESNPSSSFADELPATGAAVHQMAPSDSTEGAYSLGPSTYPSAPQLGPGSMPDGSSMTLPLSSEAGTSNSGTSFDPSLMMPSTSKEQSSTSKNSSNSQKQSASGATISRSGLTAEQEQQRQLLQVPSSGMVFSVPKGTDPETSIKQMFNIRQKSHKAGGGKIPTTTGWTYDVNQRVRMQWPTKKRRMETLTTEELRNATKSQVLPMARVKKIMKIDENVQKQMIAQDAPLLLSVASEMFVEELTLRAWQHTDNERRKILQKSDVSVAVARMEHMDFLIDVVPRVQPPPMPAAVKQHPQQMPTISIIRQPGGGQAQVVTLPPGARIPQQFTSGQGQNRPGTRFVISNPAMLRSVLQSEAAAHAAGSSGPAAHAQASSSSTSTSREGGHPSVSTAGESTRPTFAVSTSTLPANAHHPSSQQSGRPAMMMNSGNVQIGQPIRVQMANGGGGKARVEAEAKARDPAPHRQLKAIPVQVRKMPHHGQPATQGQQQQERPNGGRSSPGGPPHQQGPPDFAPPSQTNSSPQRRQKQAHPERRQNSSPTKRS